MALAPRNERPPSLAGSGVNAIVRFASAAISCVISFVLCAGCDRCSSAQSPGREQTHSLYVDLKTHASATDLAMSRKGQFAFKSMKDCDSVVWLSTSSPVGEGLVGCYDRKGKGLDWRCTGPILSCRPVEIKGLGATILLVEVGTGTGQRTETLHLLSHSDLNRDIWSGDISDWQEGLEGKNEGHRLDSGIVFVDLNGDGIDEIVQFKSTRRGTNCEAMLLSDPKIECLAYHYDRPNDRFEAIKVPRLQLVDTSGEGDQRTRGATAGSAK